jgi:poly(A) polymerase
MGNQPHDYDVATNATLEQVTELFGMRQTMILGAAFGVACVHGRVNKIRYEVEVATFRSDGSYSDGRRPDWVKFTGPEEDAQRRDFSINGMFFDPIAETLYDFVGGEQDLKRGVIRAIGDPEQRISEDKLRMLRAVRFASRFAFPLEESTAQAIARRAQEITIVSGERIAAEMTKLLETKQPGFGLQQLQRLHLMQYLLPEIVESWNDPKERARAIALMEALREKGNFASRLAALFAAANIESSVLDESLVKLKERWRLSNQDVEATEFALKSYSTFLRADQLPWSVVQPKLVASAMETGLELAEAVATVDELPRSGLERCNEALKGPRQTLDPPPLLTGNDLTKEGFQPGPVYAKILRQLRNKQLDGELNSSDEALQWLRTHRSSFESS